MSVEVDASDLADFAYFIDERCRQLEEVLRTDSRYVDWRVKRQHWGKDWKLDPFIIQDSEGYALVNLEEWEIDALNESELLSYITVQIERRGVSERTDRIQIAALLIFCLCLAPFFAILVMFPAFHSLFHPTIILIDLLLVIPILGSMWVYFRRGRIIQSKMRNIDSEAARNDSAFLEALRKLAEVQSTEKVYNEEQVKRLKYVKRTLSGYDS